MSYQEQFSRQIGFLKNSASLYDLGKVDESIRIAVSLRVLIHDTKRSTSLLSLMKLKERLKLLSTAYQEYDGVKSFGFTLTGVQMAGKKIEVTPNLHRFHTSKEINVIDWWEEKIFAMPEVGVMSRRDFALIAANKDGGAHVDKLPERFEKIKNGGVGISLSIGSGMQSDFSEMWPCTLRQMAWELLNSPDFITQFNY